MPKIYELRGASALLPIGVFLLLFIGSGAYLTWKGVELAFYQVSPAVAILPAIALAVLCGKHSLLTNIEVFLEGVRDKNILTMCMIYLLAGAYIEVLKGIGGVEATTYLVLHFIPQEATLPGVFLMSAFMSTAIGTSMGTIAAISPIALGIGKTLGIDPAFMAGAVVSGAMFGDNLSMISDTTLAATQIHPCLLRDKFKLNLLIALGPMLLTLLAFSLVSFGEGGDLSDSTMPALIFTLPYFVVLILALLGTNIFIVLSIGLILGGVVGLIWTPAYSVLHLSKDILGGYLTMSEVTILSLLIGGLSELVRDGGGIRFLIHTTDYFIQKWTTRAQGSRVVEGAISFIVSFCDICTANNVVAIILSGEATYELSQRYKIPLARTASLVTIFSCVFQGLLPYGAQLLLAGSLAGVSPLCILPHVYYCYLLGIGAVLAIIFKWPSSQERTAPGES